MRVMDDMGPRQCLGVPGCVVDEITEYSVRAVRCGMCVCVCVCVWVGDSEWDCVARYGRNR